MNNEEKKAVETLKDLASTIYYGDMNFIESDDLKIILNLIEKQQKEIDLCEETEIALNNRILDLEEINKKHQKLNRELREEIERQGNIREIEEKYIEENFISKDKIRAKIKSLEEKIHIVIPNEYNKVEIMNEFKNEGAVDILKELLEEE